MCCFYMGIAQIALDPPHPLCQKGKCGNVPQTILASLYTNPFRGNANLWKQHILKGADH